MNTYKEFFRQELQNNGYGVYGKLLQIYWEQMEFLEAPTLFRRWLATELEIPLEKINLNRLRSVLKRQRRKKKLAKQQQPRSSGTSQVHPPEKKASGFQFSKPSSDDKKPSRIIEL